MGAEALSEHLHTVGVRPGMDLVVHSKLLSFGRIVGGAATVLAALRAAVGPDATLVFPTYTFDSAETPYNPATSCSTNVGVLSELARRESAAVRSRSPIHNHAGLGPRAGLLRETPPTVSLGSGSDFEWLHQAGFHLLLLGCRFNEGGTFLHHMEAVAGVPYRRWIALERRVIDPDTGAEDTVICRYFARVEGAPPSDFDVVVDPLRRTGALGEARAPLGVSFLVALESLYRLALDRLAVDPYALVASSARGG